jgi:hypothetical protein
VGWEWAGCRLKEDWKPAENRNKLTESGLKVDWKRTGSGMEVNWKWDVSRLKVDGKWTGS